MTNGTKRPLALIILDGWGISSRKDGNAIALAHTPFYDEISANYPKTSLSASGTSVGLPADATGNAEIGHMSIGAGRIVRTDVSRIEQAVESGLFFENEVLKTAFAESKANKSSVHLIGLLSDGGVHSSTENLFGLLRMAKREGVSDVFVHCILDGRDVQPRTADIYAEALEIKMADIGIGRIASLCGRFFAMDSSENWERTARAFTMLVHAEGERSADAASAIRASFLRGIADEFIAPIVIESEPGIPAATVKDGDVVIFFNHRADSMKQLARSLSVAGDSANLKVSTVCLTEYDHSFDLPVAFPPESEINTLGQLLADSGIPNYRIAEDDRIAHVTHFFNGAADGASQYEQSIHVPSTAATREAEPEMKSFKVTDMFLRAVEADAHGVFIVNLPASDLVAESGSLEKTIESVQFVDTCLGAIVEKIRNENGVAVITSSHGNCEEMLSGRGTTGNSVPFHLIAECVDGMALRENGSLQDIAPTILGIMGIEKPAEMTGSDLRFLGTGFGKRSA
ncbi:MAG: 2,3-bisphosphoglycerate-independent phosphoglycerate mutase [Saprospiraceae bacterium]|nr:2,3-bisphosphoglycerate-independent phosphoglycerate mutase [Pyrinomonadaceae bacterium]